MWFKNLIVYRLPKNWERKADDLDTKLALQPLQPCGGFDMESHGWSCPREEGQFVYSQGRQWLVALGMEQKLLPGSVVKQVTQERAGRLSKLQDFPVGRKQMRDIKEQVLAELLPRALSRRRTTSAWIDAANGWLVVDAPGLPKAEQFVEMLRKSEDDLPAKRLDTERSPSAAMSHWLVSGEAPDKFTVDEDLELRASDATKATVRYARHGLDGKEIRDHIAAGKSPIRLGMTWNDRISFVLTEQLQIKRVSFLDILKDDSGSEVNDESEQFDIDFALMAGELSQLLSDLVEALGGEKAAA
jgi:recombination associated protein RdgC